ncbi:hypothetical protein KP509_23G023000 [Ceratopteris richardii]|uniref:Uncharacterized protein n=1 Tax=Ceratopteris richardii TaxID=49495 RepID=A0A8T2S0E2_CERRI|nr:hypothetical protein KP509_23G023000 [Ceratopteris richardii]KAH7301387.1 hypothetical protein KP509_23G023000 [Ceratopteris richardii]
MQKELSQQQTEVPDEPEPTVLTILHHSHDQEALQHLVDSSAEATFADFASEFSHDQFPHSIVWTPLPAVSWLAPFLGHVGVRREDGTILDFAGSYCISINNFAFGATARFFSLDRQQCCFPHLTGHTCKSSYKHAQTGTVLSLDDGLQNCMHHFQIKSCNPFTCTCHSFVSSFLNIVAYEGSVDWSVITILLLIFRRGQWVSKRAIAKAFGPFTLVTCLGLWVVGWPFLAGLAVFDALLIGWFLFATYLCTAD